MIIFTRLRLNHKSIYFYFEGYKENNIYNVRLVVEENDFYFIIKETRNRL